jgi:hypothetical protein
MPSPQIYTYLKIAAIPKWLNNPKFNFQNSDKVLEHPLHLPSLNDDPASS